MRMLGGWHAETGENRNAGEGVERGSKGVGKPNKALTVFAHGGGEGLQAMPTARTIQFGSDLCPYGVSHGHGKGDRTSRPGPERSTYMRDRQSVPVCSAHVGRCQSPLRTTTTLSNVHTWQIVCPCTQTTHIAHNRGGAAATDVAHSSTERATSARACALACSLLCSAALSGTRRTRSTPPRPSTAGRDRNTSSSMS